MAASNSLQLQTSMLKVDALFQCINEGILLTAAYSLCLLVMSVIEIAQTLLYIQCSQKHDALYGISKYIEINIEHVPFKKSCQFLQNGTSKKHVKAAEG